MQHTDFLKSLKALKSNLTKKKVPHTYHQKTTNKNAICDCKDSNGDFKTLYKTKDELEYMLSSKSVKLKAFSCPYEKGWHLTKG